MLMLRAADTENNTKVRDYIASTMRTLGWTVELDEFTDRTPYGDKRFANVVATKDPKAARRVILAAHFDSKFFATFPESQARPHARSCPVAQAYHGVDSTVPRCNGLCGALRNDA